MSKLDYVKSVEYENYVDKLVGSYGWSENKKLGTFEELKEQLLYKRVVEWNEDEGESTAVLKLYHNQNEFVAASEAGLYANSGNGGYYYSVASILIKDVFYPVLESGDGEADE